MKIIFSPARSAARCNSREIQAHVARAARSQAAQVGQRPSGGSLRPAGKLGGALNKARVLWLCLLACMVSVGEGRDPPGASTTAVQQPPPAQQGPSQPIPPQ